MATGDRPSAKDAQIGVPTTYTVNITRGTTGKYGFELGVHHAPTPDAAIKELKRMKAQLLAAMPELTITGG